MSEYDPMEIVGDQVLNTAEWRRRKAQKFPEDNRNLEAAKELERLARETENLAVRPPSVTRAGPRECRDLY